MAVIHVRTIENETGAEVPGSRLSVGSVQVAVDHAIHLNTRHLAPRYTTRILYSGDFVDPAFAELTQLVQQHGLEFEVDGV